MLKFRAYGLLLIMLMSVFLVSGCGGSIDRGNGSSGQQKDDSKTDGTPNSVPDTVNVAEILDGTWLGLDGSGTATDRSADTYTWELAQAAIQFSDTKLNDNSGTTTITSRFIWSVKNPDGSYAGSEKIYRPTHSADMIRAGSDSWICKYENSEGLKHTLTVSITDKDTYSYIRITEKGEIEHPDFNYNYYEISANFRKSDSDNDEIEPFPEEDSTDTQDETSPDIAI